MPWRVALASVAGAHHALAGLPSQDSAAYEALDDGRLLGAVSDGAGSALYAATGARQAVQTVLACLKEQPWPERIPTKAIAQELFGEAFAHVRDHLVSRAHLGGYDVLDLSCTLLAFMAAPKWLAASQAGDGFIVARAEDGDTQLLCEPHRGEYANETLFVTQPEAAEELHVRVLPAPCAFICAATDALEGICLDLRHGRPHKPFFEQLECFCRRSAQPAQVEQGLAEFLASGRLNARTDDDRTLLVACR